MWQAPQETPCKLWTLDRVTSKVPSNTKSPQFHGTKQPTSLDYWHLVTSSSIFHPPHLSTHFTPASLAFFSWFPLEDLCTCYSLSLELPPPVFTQLAPSSPSSQFQHYFLREDTSSNLPTLLLNLRTPYQSISAVISALFTVLPLLYMELKFYDCRDEPALVSAVSPMSRTSLIA